MNFLKLFYTLCFTACFIQAEAQGVVLEINTNKSGAEIAPTMYGIFLKTSIMAPTVDFMANW